VADRSCRAAARVAVDFDGVLHQKSGRFSDELTGDSVPGAADGDDQFPGDGRHP